MRLAHAHATLVTPGSSAIYVRCLCLTPIIFFQNFCNFQPFALLAAFMAHALSHTHATVTWAGLGLFATSVCQGALR